MKRSLPFVTVVGLGASLAFNVSADAPQGQYANFTYLDVRITDNFTHLVWDRAVSAPLSDATQIGQYCVAPTRLPTVKELLTLVDETPSLTYDSAAQKNVDVQIDLNAFPNTKVDAPYCTQTFDTSSGLRFVVDFGNGQASAAVKACRVRCVHYVGP